MLSAGGNKPTGKSGRRKRKGPQSPKAEQQTKAGQQPDHAPVQVQDAGEETGVQDAREEISVVVAREEISAPVASSDSSPPDTSAAETSAIEASAAETSATVPVVSADTTAVSPQTIANAYGDYASKSLEQTWSYFEKLAAVRSPDKALEVQTEFAKQAYETFIAESQKILGLQNELARQRAVFLEGFMARMTQTTFDLRAARN